MKNNTFQDELLSAALKYQKIFHVLPVKSGDKHPRFSWKSYQEEKPTEDWIISKFQEINPNGLVAVTGKTPGIFVIDIDPGAKVTTEDFPKTLTAKTGRDGYHLYYKYPSNAVIRSITNWREHTDVRADGGLIKLPPSKHANGKFYEWVDETTSIAEPPLWLIEELTNNRKSNQYTDWSELPDIINEGERNSTLTKLCGKLLQQTPEKDWQHIIPYFLKSINQSKCSPPLPEKELMSIYNSLAIKEMGTEGGNEKRPAIEVLLDILRSQTHIFFNQFKQPCFQIDGRTYVETLPSDLLRRKLLLEYYQEESKTVPKGVVNQAIDIFLAELENSSDVNKTEVSLRIGRNGDNLIYDIGDHKNFIEISNKGWGLINNSPILFQSQKSQNSQVIPDNDEIDLAKLFDFINVTDHEDQLLVLVYLVCSFIPDIPRPVLSAHGSQGSAKTTGLRIIRSLIDPANPAIVSPPKNRAEMVQLASHNYVLLLDNLSYLSDDHSDAICRFVTGDGYSKRQLFSDDEDFLYSFRRVVGLSAINQIADKPDLLSRCLIIKFERLDPSKRVTETKLWKEFELVKPKLFGSLLSMVSKTLSIVDQIQDTGLIRMADFHQYASAAALALGYTQKQLDLAMIKNTARQNQEALEVSGVAKAIIRFMEGKNLYEGSSSDLFLQLENIAKTEFSKSDFPKGSNWLWRKMEHVIPNLLEVGITCEHDTTKPAHSIIRLKNNGVYISNMPSDNLTDSDNILEQLDDFESDKSGSMEALEEKGGTMT